MLRLGAGLIALAALGTLVVRLYLNMVEDEVGVSTALWHLYRFFTIWTTTLIGAVCAWMALGGRPAQWIAAGLVMAIVMVAGVYHALLAHLNTYVGVDLVIDLMFHTLIPIAFVAFWVFVLPKTDLRPRDLMYWMAYPFIYCIYALVRGALDGTYPYGFLNVTELGAGGAAINIAALVVVFALAGLVILGIGRLAARRKTA